MAIQDIMSTGAGVGMKTVLSPSTTISEITSATIKRLVSGAAAQLSSLWDGGFVGIDTTNYKILTEAIDKHVSDLETIISNFNTEAYIDGALKGQARDEAVVYVKAIKDLLSAYATSYREFNRLLTGHAHGDVITDGSIMASMMAGDQQNAQGINTNAQAILDEAAHIRID